MIVRVDAGRCCSAGMCVLTAPQVFDQWEEDGTVRLLAEEPAAEHEASVREAADLCPSRAIGVVRAARGAAPLPPGARSQSSGDGDGCVVPGQ